MSFDEREWARQIHLKLDDDPQPVVKDGIQLIPVEFDDDGYYATIHLENLLRLTQIAGEHRDLKAEHGRLETAHESLEAEHDALRRRYRDARWLLLVVVSVTFLGVISHAAYSHGWFAR